MAPVIIAKDLYKCYPGFAPVLRGADLEVQPGEAAAIMGPSGCGKSTMLHILGLLHKPDAGSLEILGKNVLTLTGEEVAAFRRGNMGFVMQANNLFEHSTVFENVEFPLIYDNVPPRERWARVIRALDLVRLSGRVHYRSNRLSGGEQQRVAIARAMVNNPRVLLADEPTGALDASTSKLIMENFRRLCHAGGVALVMVTHDPKMADYCDSIYTLEEGRLRVHKHEPVPYKASGGASLLNPPEPLVRGALVTRVFPRAGDPVSLEIARRLNENLLLSQIYAAKRSGATSASGYSLSLPIRRMGRFEKAMAFVSLFRHARSSSELWKLWRELPPPASMGHTYLGQMRTFAAAGLMARWGLADKIQFAFATGARRPATLAWIAAELLKISFAWRVRGRDFARFNASWELRARAAAFVVCPTLAVRKTLIDKIPDVDQSKIYLIRDPLAIAPAREEEEGSQHPQKGKPLDILALGKNYSQSGYRLVIEACVRLERRGVPFRLTVLGKKSFSQRWLAARAGARKRTTFAGLPEQDSLAAVFKNSDLFVCVPPDGIGAELELPWQLCEAMAFGLAVVAARVSPGISEALTDKKNALVVDSDDPDDLAAALAELYAKAETRVSLGDNARKDIRALLDGDAAARQLADMIVEAGAPAEREQKG